MPGAGMADGGRADAGEAERGPVDVRRIHPYQAVKSYRCPGCHGTIPPGLGHYVVVPIEFPDERRHWHYACWERRRTRRPGRLR